MRIAKSHLYIQRFSTFAVIVLLVCAPALNAVSAGAPPRSPSKMKLHGYITARIDEQTLAILDDRIHVEGGTRITARDSAGEHALSLGDIQPGMLIEAEGVWTGHHQFTAGKMTVEFGVLDKRIHEKAYLQEEPADVQKIARGGPAELKADGEWLLLDDSTKREWSSVPANSESLPAAEKMTASPSATALAGHLVRYSGVRRKDGKIAAERVTLGPPAPAEAYKMPHGLEVVPAKDPQTGIDIIEFRHGKKVEGRMKLFPVAEVQKYVSRLGDSLLPAGARGTTKAIEFRFYVVEDASINAAALPNGTVLVNTGLLGAVENEAQLAFVLSHEVAHVLQAHYWREVHETRPQRIGLLIAGLAAGAFIGDLGVFLSELGMVAVVNGHERALENQADRLGLQNVIEHGYDPREAPKFSRLIIERYGNRTTSKLWSNHDSSVLRGSFMTVQLMRQYPEGHFEATRADTDTFRAMRDAMGPVKVQ